MKLSKDKKTLHISLNKSFTATEIESLISEIAHLRAKMTPTVPNTLPDMEEKILEQEEPSVLTGRLKKGGIRLYLSNAGLGWLAFTLTLSQSIALRDFFSANVSESNGAANFFSDKPTNGTNN